MLWKIQFFCVQYLKTIVAKGKTISIVIATSAVLTDVFLFYDIDLFTLNITSNDVKSPILLYLVVKNNCSEMENYWLCYNKVRNTHRYVLMIYI